MRIVIKKVNGGWYSDFPELPGSPFIGSGRTKVESIVALFIRNRKNIEQLDTSSVTINKKPWRNKRYLSRR